MRRCFIPDGFEFVSHRAFTDNISVVVTRVRQKSLLVKDGEDEEDEKVDDNAPIIDEDLVASDCPVCLTELANPITLMCTHYFCFVCISTWLKKQNSCPLCKKEISAFVSSSEDKSVQFWRVSNNTEKRYTLATLNNVINLQNKKWITYK